MILDHTVVGSGSIIGTGAVGGYFGGRLAQAGEDVIFILNSCAKTEGCPINTHQY